MESRWPPKSPHEALLSSPSGRKKVHQLQNRNSLSPSPLKKPSAKVITGAVSADRDGDEDEETLQLQLQALEAKLKLKKLQQRKAQPQPHQSHRPTSVESSRKENVPPSSRPKPQVEAPKAIDVPASPQKRATAAPEARSPGRVLLGIDKGLKGKNVSLRRPPKSRIQNDDPFWGSSTPNDQSRGNSRLSSASQRRPGSGKSFSERIAESRRQDNTRLEREARRQGQRSNGFGVDQKEIAAYKEDAEKEKPHGSQKETVSDRGGFSREQILQAMSKPNAGVMKRSPTSQSLRERNIESSDIWINPNAEPDILHTKSATERPRPRSQSPHRKPSSNDDEEKDAANSPSEHLFEPFSTTHLSRRLLPHAFLTRTFQEKSILRIPDLLATIKSPDYSLPDDLLADYIVLGTIASKSTPLTHKSAPKTSTTNNPSQPPTTSLDEATTSAQNASGKFLILTLTDLKWTLDLYLFTTAYTKYYKLTPGTTIAILNPSIMPPPPHKTDTGRFSLTLSSSDDTVLEIGTARDLGWCKATRKDGQQCKDWVDKRHTEFCEWHVDRVVEGNRRGRMEVNGISAPFAPGGKRGGRTGFFGGGGKGTGPRSKVLQRGFSDGGGGGEGLRREGQQYDRSTSSRYFVAPGAGGNSGGAGGFGAGSAAQLLDREDLMTARGSTKSELVRKRFAERERENEIRKRLGEKGNGAGSEYARLTDSRGDANEGGAGKKVLSNEEQRDKDDLEASKVALLGNKAKEVHLSPLKRRGLKRKATLVPESERKKTRFVTEKGIREAGRDSLGGPGADMGLDEDDELEIE